MQKTLPFLIAALVGSAISLVISIAVNATTEANEPDNDYSLNTGWALTSPAPAVSLVWAIVDIAVFYIWTYHSIHWLVTCVVLGSLNTALGIVGILLFEWSSEGAWVSGMFQLFMGIFYFVFMYFAAVAVHRHRTGKTTTQAPLKNVESADSH